jgi:DNA polymerase-3 subunit epsilon
MHDASRDIPPWRASVPLERPLAFLDLETTGTAPHRDRIIEMAIARIQPNGQTETRNWRFNPGIPIPQESSAIHGIYDEDVAREPEFHQRAREVVSFLDGCDLAGFGILGFDVPMLRIECERAGVELPMRGRRVIDAKTIYHMYEPRTLAAAHEFYCGELLTGAHAAEADALAAYRVLLGELARYKDLPQTMDGLHTLCNPDQADWVDEHGRLIWKGDEVYFNFGKHRGEPVREVCVSNPEYVNHLIDGDFGVELKGILARAMQGRFPSRNR